MLEGFHACCMLSPYVMSDPTDCSPSGFSVHEIPSILGKNTGVGCHSLLQRIFLTQELNLGLLH